MPDSPKPTDALGPNAWLVDEMYEQYLANPASVSAAAASSPPMPSRPAGTSTSVAPSDTTTVSVSPSRSLSDTPSTALM